MFIAASGRGYSCGTGVFIAASGRVYIIKRLTYEHIDMGVELSLYGT